MYDDHTINDITEEHWDVQRFVVLYHLLQQNQIQRIPTHMYAIQADSFTAYY